MARVQQRVPNHFQRVKSALEGREDWSNVRLLDLVCAANIKKECFVFERAAELIFKQIRKIIFAGLVSRSDKHIETVGFGKLQIF